MTRNLTRHTVAGLSVIILAGLCFAMLSGCNTGIIPDRVSDVNNLEVSSIETLTVGEVVLVNDPEVSKYAFYYYVPSTTPVDSPVRTVVLGNGSPSHDTYSDLALSMKGNTENFASYCDTHGYALIKTLIPGEAQYMKRHTMFPREYLYETHIRPDLEVSAIIGHFLEKAGDSGLTMHDKVFYTGFSNGGIQANIFPVLHPDIVEATAIGAAGLYLFPKTRHEGTKIKYPIGIYDLSDLTDIGYSPASFQEVEHYVFVGENDTLNDPIWELESKIDYYKENFGETTVDRVPVFTDYLVSLGMTASYEIYPGVGHEWTSGMIDDTFAFFNGIVVE